jgi:hypothetical protein
MAYGGYLTQEYEAAGSFFRLLLRLDQQGIARQVPDSDVEAETKRLRDENLCVSNDQHIVALARIGKIRLLCSEDQLLADDFKNPTLISASSAESVG